MSGERTIGAALPRKEDYRFVTGQGRYLDDIAVPGCLYAHFVRSPMHMPASSRSTARQRARPTVLWHW